MKHHKKHGKGKAAAFILLTVLFAAGGFHMSRIGTAGLGPETAQAGEIVGRGHGSKNIESLSEYALSLFPVTPHPEWDGYVKDCFDTWQRLPDSSDPSFLTVRRTADADEIVRISHYINNEFGFARGVYVSAYGIGGGSCTLGFERIRGRSGVLKSYRFEAENMKKKAAELKGATETETLFRIFGFAAGEMARIERTGAEGPEGETEEEPDPRDAYYGWFSGNALNCNGRAKLISMMARMNGLKAQVVFGTLGEESHAWTEVYADGTLWYCDAQVQSGPLAALPESYVREPGWPELPQ